MKYSNYFVISLFCILGICSFCYLVKIYHYSNPVCSQNISYASEVPEHPFFSIVMTTYNREEYLKHSICSALAQTYDNFELVIIDDGSKDMSARLIKAFQKKDKRIVFIQNNKNRGISFNRNRLIDIAKGEYITTLDSDDSFLPELLAETKSYIDKNPQTDLVHGYIVSMEKDGFFNIENIWGSAWLESIFIFNAIQNTGTSYRRQFVLDHKMRYDEKYMNAEDYLFWAQMLINGAKVGMIKKVLAAFRLHHTNSKEYYSKMKQNANKVKKILREHFSTSSSLNYCLLYRNLTEEAKQYFSKEHLETIRNTYCFE